jgi:uncharacterized delta-60 repeat protein
MRTGRLTATVCGVGLALVGITASATAAPPGEAPLDTSFGEGGRATTAVFGETGFLDDVDEIYDLASGPGGTIVAKGSAYDVVTESYYAVVARYDADGELDPSFADDGIAEIAVPGFATFAPGLAVAPDGAVFAAGLMQEVPGEFGGDLAAAKLTSDGRLDPAFSGDGIASAGLGRKDEEAFGLVLGADGTVTLAGTTGSQFAGLARFLPNGDLDPNFGDTGTAVIPRVKGTYANSAAAGPDATLLIAHHRGVARVSADGRLDSSFGRSGFANVSLRGTKHFLRGDDGIAEVAVAPDGGIVAGGTAHKCFRGCNQEWGDALAARFKPGGKPDNSFGHGGIATGGLGGRNEVFGAVALLPNRKIAVGGSTNEEGHGRFEVVRFKLSGRPDSSFAPDGISVTKFRGHAGGRANALLAEPGGRLIAGGRAGTDEVSVFALVAFR